MQCRDAWRCRCRSQESEPSCGWPGFPFLCHSNTKAYMKQTDRRRCKAGSTCTQHVRPYQNRRKLRPDEAGMNGRMIKVDGTCLLQGVYNAVLMVCATCLLRGVYNAVLMVYEYVPATGGLQRCVDGVWYVPATGGSTTLCSRCMVRACYRGLQRCVHGVWYVPATRDRQRCVGGRRAWDTHRRPWMYQKKHFLTCDAGGRLHCVNNIHTHINYTMYTHISLLSFYTHQPLHYI